MAKHGKRSGSKRKASKKWGGGRGGKVRRRLFGRKRTSYRRKWRRTGNFGNVLSRKYAKGLNSHHISGDVGYTFSGDADGHVHLFFFNPSEFSQSFDDHLAKSIDPYTKLFDQWKINRVRLEFWLNDNDEWVKQDAVMPTCTWVYDPDCGSRKATADTLREVAGNKRIMLVPGKVYSCSFKPLWTVKTGNVKLYAFNKWMDGNDIQSDNGCSNGIQMYFNIPDEVGTIKARTHYYLSWRGRRQGQTYQA